MVSSNAGSARAFSAALLCALAVGCGSADGLSPDSEEGLATSDQALGVWDFVSIESYNIRGMYIRHRNYLGELTSVSSGLDRADATFRLVPGLANAGCVSFESSNFPGYFLRHQFYRLKLNPSENADLYRRDATFCIKPALQPGVGSPWVSFESYNFPGSYIRHRDYHLYIESSGGPFREDATFRYVNPL